MSTEILPTKSAKRAVAFTDEGVSFKSIDIPYSQVVGVSFESGSFNGRGSYRLKIRSEYKAIKVNFGDNFIFGLSQKEVQENYRTLCAAAVRRTGPSVLKRLEGWATSSSARIGNLNFTTHGITSIGFFGKHRTVEWSMNPTISEGGFWYGIGSMSGIMNITYFDRKTGITEKIGSASSGVENGCFVPELMRRMKERFSPPSHTGPQQPPPTANAPRPSDQMRSFRARFPDHSQRQRLFDHYKGKYPSESAEELIARIIEDYERDRR